MLSKIFLFFKEKYIFTFSLGKYFLKIPKNPIALAFFYVRQILKNIDMPQQNSRHLLTAEANFECDPNDQHFGVFYINKKQKNKIVSGFHTHACTKVLPWTS